MRKLCRLKLIFSVYLFQGKIFHEILNINKGYCIVTEANSVFDNHKKKVWGSSVKVLYVHCTYGQYVQRSTYKVYRNIKKGCRVVFLKYQLNGTILD